MISNGDFRNPLEVVFADLKTRLTELRDQRVIAGGDLSVRTHKDASNKLFLDTMFVDVVSHFKNKQPTFKSSTYPLDKVLVSPNYLPKVRGYYVAPFDLLCKSDHAEMVVDLTWTDEFLLRRSSGENSLFEESEKCWGIHSACVEAGRTKTDYRETSPTQRSNAFG